MYRLNKPRWRILLYFARLLKHSFYLIIERFLCGSIILTVTPNTARTVDNKTCKKCFVERSFNFEIAHYAAASRRNCDTQHVHGLHNTATRNVASACMTSLETNVLTQKIWAHAFETRESTCSQTVSLSPAISSQFILGVCTAAENRKNQ